MKLYIVLIATVVLIANNTNCGVVEGVFNKISNTTQAVKEDIYSWWAYGVDTVMGEHANKNADSPTAAEDESGVVGKLYNKVRGGVSSGYMKVHDYILGDDSDPNKTIIRTLFERAMKRLSAIKSYVFGDSHHAEKPESQKNDEVVKEQVLRMLFSNKTDIFNTESELSALNSLRNKLTQTGDEVLNLANNERDVIRKAYESVRRKSGEILTKAEETADRNKMNDNIEKTQEYIRDESKKINEAVKNVGDVVKKASDDVGKRIQSESTDSISA